MAPQSAFYDPPYTPTTRRSASPASSDGIGAYRPAGNRRPTVKASRRAPWTAQQDAILVEVIQAHLESTGNTEIAWTAVGKAVSKRLGENGARPTTTVYYTSTYLVPTVTGKRCRLRWHDHLQPGLRHDPFDEVEKAILCEMYGRTGTQWSAIARLLPGRSDNAVKNTFHSINNKNMVDHYIDLYNKLDNPVLEPREPVLENALAAAQAAAAQYETVTIACPPLPTTGRRASKRTLESASSEEAATMVSEPVKRVRRTPTSDAAPQRTSLRIALRRQRSEEHSEDEGSPTSATFSTVVNGTTFKCQTSGSSQDPCNTICCMGSELSFELPSVPHTASQESIIRWMSTLLLFLATHCFSHVSPPQCSTSPACRPETPCVHRLPATEPSASYQTVPRGPFCHHIRWACTLCCVYPCHCSPTDVPCYCCVRGLVCHPLTFVCLPTACVRRACWVALPTHHRRAARLLVRPLLRPPETALFPMRGYCIVLPSRHRRGVLLVL